MMSFLMDDLDRNEDVLAFVETCKRFIALCEDDPRDEAVRLPALRAAMGDLLARVAALPEVPDHCEDSYGRSDDELRARIGPKYRTLGFYNEVLNPSGVGEAPDFAIGDAIDDLIDTVRELRGGLSIWDDGRRTEAVGHWRLTFDIHWSEHVVRGLRAIHEAVKESRSARGSDG